MDELMMLNVDKLPLVLKEDEIKSELNILLENVKKEEVCW